MSDRETGPEGWDSLGVSWRSETPAASSFEDVDPGAVRARADAFARKIRWRNVREVVAGIAVGIAGARIAFAASSPLVAAGGVSMTIGALLVTAVIVTRGRNTSPPSSDAPTREVLAFERSELDRQARLLEKVWLWYLAPFLPCILAIYAASFSAALAAGRTRGMVVSIGLFAATIGFFCVIGWVNTRAARGLRRRMKALPPDMAEEARRANG